MSREGPIPAHPHTCARQHLPLPFALPPFRLHDTTLLMQYRPWRNVSDPGRWGICLSRTVWRSCASRTPPGGKPRGNRRRCLFSAGAHGSILAPNKEMSWLRLTPTPTSIFFLLATNHKHRTITYYRALFVKILRNTQPEGGAMLNTLTLVVSAFASAPKRKLRRVPVFSANRLSRFDPFSRLLASFLNNRLSQHQSNRHNFGGVLAFLYSCVGRGGVHCEHCSCVAFSWSFCLTRNFQANSRRQNHYRVVLAWGFHREYELYGPLRTKKAKQKEHWRTAFRLKTFSFY